MFLCIQCKFLVPYDDVCLFIHGDCVCLRCVVHALDRPVPELDKRIVAQVEASMNGG